MLSLAHHKAFDIQLCQIPTNAPLSQSMVVVNTLIGALYYDPVIQ